MLPKKPKRCVGKRSRQAVAAATVTNPPHSRLFFLFDNTNGLQFIVNTGAEISLIPPDPKQRYFKSSPVTLGATSNADIPTYDQRLITLDLGLGRQFSFVPTITQVHNSILGINFLKHPDILVDARSRKIIDRTTTLMAIGTATSILAF